ncbi:DDE-type integrase/transposase/recombinase [Streptomyces sp. NPDC002476]|uniref:DDE-type integrase/transposase/recombinase n=1 Tax=Streptomyces sp. NPDC002476 TaxID=3364648 RepID=UPI0036BF6AEF
MFAADDVPDPVRRWAERRTPPTGHPPRTILELVAHGPSQVFTWDITRLPGPAKGIWFHAYVISDIFSRYIVGHTVERAETAEQAEELIRETIERDGIVPHTVHAGRGTLMTSKKVSQLLTGLGVTRSHSRPRVSDENPFSESPQTAAPGARRRSATGRSWDPLVNASPRAGSWVHMGDISIFSYINATSML